MSLALRGEIVTISFELAVDGVDTDTTTVPVVLVHPDGTSDSLTATHDGTGLYDLDIDTAPLPGDRYVWIANATGAVQAVAAGYIDVVDPLDVTAPLVDVQPWCDASAVRTRPGCSGLDQRQLDECARAATGILYALSGRQFSGRATGYVRPIARPAGGDLGLWRTLAGWYGSWGTCVGAYGYGYAGASLATWSGHACSCYPDEVELGAYPVTAITAVKIDGQTIPADEYRIDNHRHLVRVRPTTDAAPTARAGWPTCQRLDLPDTEDGTFSVAFVYGTPPPIAGVRAAATLAAELAIASAPDGTATIETRLPDRVRSIVRQGESITVIDPQDVLDKGRTGIPEVDLFLKSVNPAGLQRRSSVWSPDLGHARRPN